MRNLVVVVVIATLCACGSKKEASKEKSPTAETSAPADDPGGGIDIEGFCKRTMAGNNPNQCWGKDKQSEMIKASFCVDTLRTPERAGKITVDAARLAACEKAAVEGAATLDNKRSLPDLAEAFEACRDVTTGHVKAGAECIGTMECEPGLVCNRMKCAAPGAEGAECTPVIELTLSVVDTTCAAGLYCDIGDGVCKKTKAKDAECVLSEECGPGQQCRNQKCVAAGPSKTGEECDDPKDCPAGNTCSPIERHCEPLRADGASCMSDTECLHRCVTDSDSFSGSCGPC